MKWLTRKDNSSIFIPRPRSGLLRLLALWNCFSLFSPSPNDIWASWQTFSEKYFFDVITTGSEIDLSVLTADPTSKWNSERSRQVWCYKWYCPFRLFVIEKHYKLSKHSYASPHSTVVGRQHLSQSCILQWFPHEFLSIRSRSSAAGKVQRQSNDRHPSHRRRRRRMRHLVLRKDH